MAIHTSSRLLAALRVRSHSSHIVPRTRYLFYFASSRGTRLGRTRPGWTNLRRTHTLGPGLDMLDLARITAGDVSPPPPPNFF